MASTSRSEADAMIIRLQEAQVRLQESQVRLQEAQVRLQEAQVTLLDLRMLGSLPAAGTSTPIKDAEGDPEKETVPVTGDGQDGMAVLSVVPMEEPGEIIEEQSEANNEEDPLKGMDLREWCNQDPLKWKYALRGEDCKSLMTQLREDPSLMMLTVDGRTVLHVASIRGCTLLIHQVLQKRQWNLGSRLLYYNHTPTGVDAVHTAVDERTQLTAYDINQFFVGQNYSTPPTDSSVNTPPGSPADDINNYHSGQLVELIRADINQLLLDETNRKVAKFLEGDEVYYFDPEHIEFTFHHAFIKLLQGEQCYKHYVETVIGCLMKGGGEKLNCLLQLQDQRGNPPFGFIDGSFSVLDFIIEDPISIFKDLLQSSAGSFGIFINATDARGWTFLHKCAAWGHHQAVERLMKEESIDGNLTLPNSRATPLHLAILHNHPQVVKSLLMAKDKINVNAIFRRRIVYGDENNLSGNERGKYRWTPLQLAAIMGHSDVVRELLMKVEQIHDVGKRVKNVDQNDNVSALHMAAASGMPEVLRLFLNNGAFNPLELTTRDKRSALHFAIDTTTPCLPALENEFIKSFALAKRKIFMYKNPILKITDFASLHHHIENKKNCENDTMDPKSHWRTKEEYGGKMACITMLLQAGIDVWQQDGEKNYAEPGAKASTDVRLWWYERVAQETLEAKKNLNDAGNAISVVAALVATASYVGPLQPPLGYASDITDPTNSGLVQATNLMVRVFVVSNCLSFYLAIGSIMFAVVPSLPMPQEGIFEEWQRSRRSVGLAMSFLVLSILGVLVSFGAASNVGMSNHYSWQHLGLAFYPALFGGLACLLGIFVFFIRLLRLILHKNERIRYVYQKLP